MSFKSTTVDRLRACLARPGFSAVTIAGLAGVHPKTLRDYESDSWNPTLQTLESIMRVVTAIEEIAKED